MSENDKDPRSGEFTDPTASPDWTAPSGSQDPAPSPPGATDAPQTSPTEQIPQGTQVPPPPAVDAPYSPNYDAPYQSPRSDSNPYAGSSAQPTNPYAATPPPAGDPYAAQQPAYDPYAATGGSAPQGGYPAYNAPGQWQAPPAYGAAPPQNTSALVLTILSGIGLVLCCQVFMIGSLILGIMGLTKNADDPEGARKMAKWGWVVFAASIVLSIIGIAIFIALGASGALDGGGYSSDSDYTY
ncbi:hypothetical protein V6K52_16435 [Knoellia sp. S7-12]|uniref:DUF4190 domain-containing protein n=1 Tax=Knoellia sp. S7-12 TaxID=3126698 RepID=UPI003369B785